jgi:hypothetical protein
MIICLFSLIEGGGGCQCYPLILFGCEKRIGLFQKKLKSFCIDI